MFLVTFYSQEQEYIIKRDGECPTLVYIVPGTAVVRVQTRSVIFTCGMSLWVGAQGAL